MLDKDLRFSVLGKFTNHSRCSLEGGNDNGFRRRIIDAPNHAQGALFLQVRNAQVNGLQAPIYRTANFRLNLISMRIHFHPQCQRAEVS